MRCWAMLAQRPQPPRIRQRKPKVIILIEGVVRGREISVLEGGMEHDEYDKRRIEEEREEGEEIRKKVGELKIEEEKRSFSVN